MRCEGRDQDQVRLIPGSVKRLAYISFGTNDEGLVDIKRRLQNWGTGLVADPFGSTFGGIWFRDPHGDLVNVQVAADAPSTLPPAPEFNSGDRIRRVGERACGRDSLHKRAQPRRLGHLIKFSTDVQKSIEFYTEVLGMKVSDRAGDIVAFLRCGSGGDHHVLGLAKSSHSGLHHLSFEVRDIDEMEIGAQTLVAAGYADCFGPGRHVQGSNYFHYIRDPWNSLVEYYWEMDYIPADCEWEAIDFDASSELRPIWASGPAAPDFTKNFEQA